MGMSPTLKPLEQITDEERARLFPIILSAYNPAWSEWFKEEKLNLERLIGTENIVRVLHYGSTAIPGLTAKPTVDIMLEINEDMDVDSLIDILPYPEYIPQRQEFPEEKLMFYKGYTHTGFAERVYHIHVRYHGDWDELRFRDYLIAHPEIAARYAALKLKLKEKFEYDRDGYTDAKGDFIREITREGVISMNEKTYEYDAVIQEPSLKEIRAKIGKQPGDTVHVTVKKRDSKEASSVVVPEELATILSGDEEAQAFYDSLTDGYKRGYCDWVGGAKQAATRQSRAEKALVMLQKKQKTLKT
jgi:GrpB-like predicted nucleotidyltransferase (UPF0157 family)